MITYLNVYRDLTYTDFPESSNDRLYFVYIYEPLPKQQMSLLELCNWLNENKSRTSAKVIIDKYYYGILLVNYISFPWEPGAIYGYLSFFTPLKNVTIKDF